VVVVGASVFWAVASEKAAKRAMMRTSFWKFDDIFEQGKV
jgi:hypothetical protein